MIKSSKKTVIWWLCVSVLIGVNSCDLLSDSSKKEPVVEEDTIKKDTTPDQNSKLFGNFLIELKEPEQSDPGFTYLLGKFFDGPSLSRIIWEEADKIGACRLLTPRVPFCESCDEVCVEDNVCKSEAASLTPGTIQVEGLKTVDGKTSFSMEPIANNYQKPGSVSLQYPPFSEGDDISVTVKGDTSSDAFTLKAEGIRPLIALHDPIVLRDGQPVQLKWEAPQNSTNTAITVEMDISHHGGKVGLIECDAPDTGSLEIAATLIDKLKALGMFGWPKIELTRKSIGSSPSTKAELTIQSSVVQYFEIPGIISCFDNLDCPDGQSCSSTLKCQ